MEILFASFASYLLAVLVVLATIAWIYVRHVLNHWQQKGVPFVPPKFPFGNFKEVFLIRQSFAEHTHELYNSSADPVLGIWTAFRPTLFVRDPDVVRQVLIKDFNTFHDRGLYCNEETDPLSGHLFLLPGEKWRHLRGKLSPTFTTGKLKAMFSALVACSGSLDGYVDRVATDARSIEVRELLAEYTTNIIASVAFGIEIDCIADPNNSFRKYGRKVFEPTIKNGLIGATSFLFPKLLKLTRTKLINAEVESFMLSLVKDTMEYRENNNVTRKDFFQLLLQLRNTGQIQEDDEFTATATSAHKSLSINECAAQAFVFFAAGFETSSTTMSFALYEFAKNPECMRRAQQEIDDVLARHDGQITYDSVSEMKYLDWCIDETLRIYPPVPFLNRESREPWTIPNTNITIDKGTAIVIPAIALQHDPKYWPQPDCFIPERFSPDQSAGQTFIDRPYMPFGEGPRNCIGSRLGKLQTKVGLITMLQKYNYELDGVTKQPLKMAPSAFLLTPIGGINLKISHRSRN